MSILYVRNATGNLVPVRTVQGATGPGGEDGKDYVLTDDDKAEIAQLAGAETVPDYWKAALDTGVQTINSAVESAGRNKSAFLFYTDAHWGYGSGMSPKLLKYLSKHTAINKTVFGGDFGNTYEYPDTGKTMNDWMNVMREWRLAVRDVPNHHSVVGNHDQDVDAINSDKALYGFLFAPEETSDIVRGGDFFYYIDEPNERTRYLYLNTGLCDFSDDQCKFFIDALKNTPDSWHIVAVSHIWFMYDDTSDPTVGSVPVNIQKVLKLFDDYNTRVTGSMTIDTESHAYDFTDCKGWVEFCIGGHTHVDYSFTSDSGIPVILCQTDSKHLRGSLYTYTEGTITEAAVSAIVADYDDHKIHVIRVGRGESSEIEITNYVVSYTNVLPLALAADGESIYNADGTPGYKANTRWSSSGNSESASDGKYLTGWIPCKIGDTVYLKNVTMPKTDANVCLVHQFNNSFATAVQNSNPDYLTSSCNAVWDADGNLTQFTLPANTSPTTHIRIQCGGISEVSVITINEPIE
jgi:hypothetical protein